MQVSRRDALKLGVLGGAGAAALTGCRQAVRSAFGDDLPTQLSLPKGPVEATVRLMNRAGFGPRPGDVAHVQALGRQAWVDAQLEAKNPEPLALTLQLRRLDVQQLEAAELRDIKYEEIIRQLQQAQLLHAVYSPNQLRERMVDFWTNHFNIYIKKALGAHMKGSDERNVVRKHALGSFPEMLRASAKSPAMLAYLDNNANRKGGANENYARELLELHTLGVDGGYTQSDIQEVARCFSGWGIETRFLHPVGKFRFDPDLHDDGPKQVLGKRIPPNLGEKDADLVLELLAEHPSTAAFLAKKLALYFLGRRDANIETRIQDAYLTSKGSIPAMLKEVLNEEALESADPIVKRPFDFVVSALRAVDADTPAHFSLQNHLRTMGQPGYEWPMPDGYPLDMEAWTGSLLGRWNFAFALMGKSMGDVQPRLNDLRSKFKGSNPDFLAHLFFGVSAKHPSLTRFLPVLERRLGQGTEVQLAEAASLCLCAPQFQWR